MTAAIYHVPSISHILTMHPSKQSVVAFYYAQCHVKTKGLAGLSDFPKVTQQRQVQITVLSFPKSPY